MELLPHIRVLLNVLAIDYIIIVKCLVYTKSVVLQELIIIFKKVQNSTTQRTCM